MHCHDCKYCVLSLLLSVFLLCLCLSWWLWMMFLFVFFASRFPPVFVFVMMIVNNHVNDMCFCLFCIPFSSCKQRLKEFWADGRGSWLCLLCLKFDWRTVFFISVIQTYPKVDNKGDNWSHSGKCCKYQGALIECFFLSETLPFFWNSERDTIGKPCATSLLQLALPNDRNDLHWHLHWLPPGYRVLLPVQ